MSAETVEGYFDGLKDEPKPGDNRGPDYVQGWENGMVDGGHMEKMPHQAERAYEFLKAQKSASTQLPITAHKER